MLTLSHYDVAYGQSRIISDLSLEVRSNEIVALVGRNGMGKTTLMKSLIGMIPSQAGSVAFNHEDISTLKSYQRVRKGIGFVPQGRMVFSTMTVEENIKTGLPASANKNGVPHDLYDIFPVLRDMRHRLAGNLSGGQQQQLVMARALAGRPKLLLLDEPTEGIQPSIIKEMAKILRAIRDERGLTIVVSEQVLSFVMDVADRILVMEKGAIVHQEDRQRADENKIAAYLSV
ncbi:urea ABC transporter ATP-binding subunit UrtE [Affinibrenneria salicis]|uniref:Urea ABC transporter ATP-binding subunit UrtE n=1 Tax=Affinibrenneria salicis TaxID=2590031 RepID=A0A5J5FYX8_9GAMM|nr:urea ABC transporter ATP-binding subunit UrtE [Affinibrenneria salicis]KAA8999428.1 urea ABC transporter ATP-binding subunit UrtE [Affinibrenneria salicis]